MSVRSATSIKPFMPAKDYLLSLDFYQKMGWKLIFDNGNIAELNLGDSSFFLQDFYVKDWAHNMMLYINIDDAQDWHDRAQELIAENDFASARVKVPELQDHGDLVTFVWDPCGVLLDFAQTIPASNS